MPGRIPSPAHVDPLLDLIEAGQIGFGAYSTLRKKITSGVLPAVKVNGRIKVRLSDLEALAVPTNERTFEDVEAAIERLVAAAPPLTPEQTRRLRDLLGGA